MTKVKYGPHAYGPLKTMRQATLTMIERINVVLDEYAYPLTNRQVHYQFVARNWYDNTDTNARLLMRTVRDGRNAGLIDWDKIIDRSREELGNQTWSSAKALLAVARDGFALDKWTTQPYAPVVWVEKRAAVGVIEDVCNDLGVRFLATSGYNGTTVAREYGEQCRAMLEEGRRSPVVLHLGDHDPSGVDMSRDLAKRLRLYSGQKIDVRRLALNLGQVRRSKLPSQKVKKTDTRTHAYEQKYGGECWELDALDPDVIADLIRTAVMAVRDEDLWAKALRGETRERRWLQRVVRSA